MEETLAAARLVTWGNFHVCVFDRTSLVIRACTDSLAELAGHPKGSDLVGSFVIDLFSLDSLAVFEQFLLGGDFSATAQCRMAGPDTLDTRMAVALSAAPGEEAGLLTMICVPVLDQESVISELGAKAASLELRNAQLSEFSNLLVHDLRGLLHNISAELELLLIESGGDFSSSSREHLERVHGGTESMNSVLEGVTRLLRLSIGDYPTELTDLNAVVDAVLETAVLGLGTGTSIQRNDPLPTLICQRQLIEEVFRNLVENAIKYRGEAALQVEIGSVEKETPTFFVKDNGVGIHPDDLSSVLEPLRRADRQHLNSRGSGMGLALVKRIVEQHGGRIWLESELGVGTTVWFSLSETGGLG
jgi:signal transduction histidine kinase